PNPTSVWSWVGRCRELHTQFAMSSRSTDDRSSDPRRCSSASSGVPSSSSTRTSAEDATPPPNKRFLVPVVGIGVLAIALAGGFALAGKRSHTITGVVEQPTTNGTAGDLITLTVRIQPESASAFVDDVPLIGNPATLKLKRDGASHRIRGEAPGHLSE